MIPGTKILSCFISAILIVFFLQQYAHHREGVPNGFNRTIFKNVLKQPSITELGKDSYYIIGSSDTAIYLGNHARSRQVLILPYDGCHVDTAWLTIPKSIRFGWGAAKIHKQGQWFYLTEGITPHVFRFSRLDSIGTKLNPGINHFDLIIPQDSFSAFRTYDTALHRNILAYAPYGPHGTTAPDILEDQQDGVFSTDGMLLYDSLTARFLYVYYYRNQLMSFDKHFKNIVQGKTIDTVTLAKIQLHPIKSDHSITFSAPPLKVNKHACTNNGLLFIYSGLRGDNEKGKIAFKSTSIDVYNIKGLKYLGSFYVPNYDGKGIRDMAVYNNMLVTLRGSELAVFNVHLNNFISTE